MTLLDVQDLSTGYGKKEILSGISFSINSHELVGILGINGSGKTTLLKAICGILPYKGTVRLCGRDIRQLTARELAKRSRYIPQRTGLSLDISLLDVVLMGFNPQLKLLEYPSITMKQQGLEALKRVGLAQRAFDNFQSLSEGQKQLCILARTMLLEKGILFLDEPESALDFSGRYQILEFLRQKLLETESGAVVTLHDPQLALNTCDKLLLIQEGKLFSVLSPKSTPIDEIEKKLSDIFGPLSLHRCCTRGGKEQIVLLKEGYPWKQSHA